MAKFVALLIEVRPLVIPDWVWEQMIGKREFVVGLAVEQVPQVVGPVVLLRPVMTQREMRILYDRMLVF